MTWSPGTKRYNDLDAAGEAGENERHVKYGGKGRKDEGHCWRLLVCVFLLLPLACSHSEKTPYGKAAADGTVARSKPFQASVLREPFHKSTCRWAAKISTSNPVGYDTREEVIADGQRPCRVCKP